MAWPSEFSSTSSGRGIFCASLWQWPNSHRGWQFHSGSSIPHQATSGLLTSWVVVGFCVTTNFDAKFTFQCLIMTVLPAPCSCAQVWVLGLYCEGQPCLEGADGFLVYCRLFLEVADLELCYEGCPLSHKHTSEWSPWAPLCVWISWVFSMAAASLKSNRPHIWRPRGEFQAMLFFFFFTVVILLLFFGTYWSIFFLKDLLESREWELDFCKREHGFFFPGRHLVFDDVWKHIGSCVLRPDFQKHVRWTEGLMYVLCPSKRYHAGTRGRFCQGHCKVIIQHFSNWDSREWWIYKKFKMLVFLFQWWSHNTQ